MGILIFLFYFILFIFIFNRFATTLILFLFLVTLDVLYSKLDIFIILILLSFCYILNYYKSKDKKEFINKLKIDYLLTNVFFFCILSIKISNIYLTILGIFSAIIVIIFSYNMKELEILKYDNIAILKYKDVELLNSLFPSLFRVGSSFYLYLLTHSNFKEVRIIAFGIFLYTLINLIIIGFSKMINKMEKYTWIMLIVIIIGVYIFTKTIRYLDIKFWTVVTLLISASNYILSKDFIYVFANRNSKHIKDECIPVSKLKRWGIYKGIIIFTAILLYFSILFIAEENGKKSKIYEIMSSYIYIADLGDARFTFIGLFTILIEVTVLLAIPFFNKLLGDDLFYKKIGQLLDIANGKNRLKKQPKRVKKLKLGKLRK